MIPSVSECFRLIGRYGMLEHIRDHSIIVARVADHLAGKLVRKGAQISRPLVVASALLHDIGKTACLDNDLDHEQLGRDICLELGFPRVAAIVGDHVRLQNNSLPEITENELVYYSDKRVNHDRVVSLSERKEYIIERYGRRDPYILERIEENSRKWWQVEERLAEVMDFSPEELSRLIDQDPSTCEFDVDLPEHDLARAS